MNTKILKRVGEPTIGANRPPSNQSNRTLTRRLLLLISSAVLIIAGSMAAISSNPAGAAPPDQLLFDFENNRPWWVHATNSQDQISGAIQDGEFRMRYRLESPATAWAGHNVEHQDWSQYSALSFEFAGAGNNAPVAVMFRERTVAGEPLQTFRATFQDTFSGRRTVTIPMSNFARAPHQPNGAPDLPMTLRRVEKMNLVLRAANSRIVIDNVKLIGQTNNLIRQPNKLSSVARQNLEADPPGGFVRLACGHRGDFKVANDDPLVKPNQPGRSHLHMFVGNQEIDAYSVNNPGVEREESIRFSKTSTCPGGGANMSGYWTPVVKDGRGIVQQPDEAVIYYMRGSVDSASLQPFPEGLTMIAGKAMTDAAQPPSVIRWRCRSDSFQSGIQPTIPRCPAGGEIEVSVVFPQCWDGRHLNGTDPDGAGPKGFDHTSHMAYDVSLGINGSRNDSLNGAKYYRKCPASHPIALPKVKFQFHYRIDTGENPANWFLASDDMNHDGRVDSGLAPGITMHGDWMNGWDPAIQRRWIAGCLKTGKKCLNEIDSRTKLVD